SPSAPTSLCSSFFLLNDPAPPAIYTLSLHDALPICRRVQARAHADRPADQGDRARALHAAGATQARRRLPRQGHAARRPRHDRRSEEHTSELQSLTNLVCRLLLEKKTD